jgi:hypothetical protein
MSPLVTAIKLVDNENGYTITMLSFYILQKYSQQAAYFCKIFPLYYFRKVSM